jgi:hypothetical protein
LPASIFVGFSTGSRSGAYHPMASGHMAPCSPSVAVKVTNTIPEWTCQETHQKDVDESCGPCAFVPEPGINTLCGNIERSMVFQTRDRKSAGDRRPSSTALFNEHPKDRPVKLVFVIPTSASWLRLDLDSEANRYRTAPDPAGKSCRRLLEGSTRVALHYRRSKVSCDRSHPSHRLRLATAA